MHCTETYLFITKNAHMHKVHYVGDIVKWLLKWKLMYQEPDTACFEWLTTSSCCVTK